MKKSDWPQKGAVHRRSTKKSVNTDKLTSMKPKAKKYVDKPTPYKDADHSGRKNRIEKKMKTLRSRGRKEGPKMMKKTIRKRR